MIEADDLEIWHWVIIGIAILVVLVAAVRWGFSSSTPKDVLASTLLRSVSRSSRPDPNPDAGTDTAGPGTSGRGSKYVGSEDANEYFGGGTRMARAYVTAPDFKGIQKLTASKSPEFVLFRSNKKNPFTHISVGDKYDIYESTPKEDRDVSDTTEPKSFSASVVSFTTGPISKLLTKDTFASGGFTSLSHAKEQFKKFNGEYVDDDESMQAITFTPDK
jgi:hypothetical protein